MELQVPDPFSSLARTHDGRPTSEPKCATHFVFRKNTKIFLSIFSVSEVVGISIAVAVLPLEELGHLFVAQHSSLNQAVHFHLRVV